MATTMNAASRTTVKSTRCNAAPVRATSTCAVRPVRLGRQSAAAFMAPSAASLARAQQGRKESHVVCVAAPDAPASTKVRLLMNECLYVKWGADQRAAMEVEMARSGQAHGYSEGHRA